MIPRILGVIASLLMLCDGLSHAAFFPIVEGGKYGFIDERGKVVIAPTNQWKLSNLEAEDCFTDGLEPIVESRKSLDLAGYIGTNGQVLVPFRFHQATRFSEGLAAVNLDRRWGFIDRTGKVVIAPRFEQPSSFSEGYAEVIENGLSGFIDKTGRYLVRSNSTMLAIRDGGFHEGLACVCVSDRWGFINTKGEMAIRPQFIRPTRFSEGLAAAGTNDMDGYIDKRGQFVIEPQFHKAWQFSGGLARVELFQGMHFIDKTGRITFTVTNGWWTSGFSDGLAAVSLKTNYADAECWGYINTRGRFAIEPKFGHADPFREGLAQVGTTNTWGYIDKRGTYVWGPIDVRRMVGPP